MAKDKKDTKKEAVVETNTNATFVARCGKAGCNNDFQDKKYGEDNRVFNKLKEGKGGRCTVCGQKN